MPPTASIVSQPGASQATMADANPATDGQTSQHRPLSRDRSTPPSAASTMTSMLPPPRPGHQRLGSMPSSTGRRNGKRLSLRFPVQPSGLAATSRYPPSSPASSKALSPTLASVGEKTTSTPTDSGFLVDLAAQERHVLELKEELVRAEAELEVLKRQWAMHEATKKRAEIRHVEQLQPLQSNASSMDNSSDEGLAPARTSLDQGTSRPARDAKQSRRRVISGQTHARTLSLLSPDRGGPQLMSQQSRRLTEPDLGNAETSHVLHSSTLSTSASTPAMAAASPSSDETNDGPQKDVILKTGRRMAEDFKDGLWTFFDDLRQATVGDEAIHGKGSRSATKSPAVAGPTKQRSLSRPANSRGKSTSPRRTHAKADSGALIDLGGTFWREQRSEDKDVSGQELLAMPEADRGLAIAIDSAATARDSGDALESSSTKTNSPRWSSSTFVSEGGFSPPAREISPDTGSR